MIYKRGGVVFITSRILVVDLLRRQCPVDRVAGVLVWNGHKLVSSLLSLLSPLSPSYILNCMLYGMCYSSELYVVWYVL